MNLARWDAKSRQGLPRIPEQSMPPIHEGEMDRHLFEDDHNRAQHLRAQLGTDPDQTPGSFATPTPTTPASDHARSTSHGWKAEDDQVQRLRMVLQVEKLNPPERMQTASPKEQHPDHERDYRGILHGSGSARFVAIKWKQKAGGNSPIRKCQSCAIGDDFTDNSNQDSLRDAKCLFGHKR